MNSLDEFQKFARQAWFGPKHETSTQYLIIPTLGLTGEAGEVAEKMKKHFRGDTVELDTKAVATELGDVLFYTAVLADRIGYTLSEVAQLEIDKINDRIARGTRRGEGDNR